MQPLVEKDFHALDPDIREAQQNPHGFDGILLSVGLGFSGLALWGFTAWV